MELDPPPITIVDPRLGGPDDVLEAPRPRRLGVLLLAAVLLAGGIAVAAEALSSDRNADRAVTSRVLLRAEVAAGSALEGWVRIGLRNDGPEAVELVSARLLAEGYAPLTVGTALPAKGIATLAFRDTARCGPALLSDPAWFVSVRLRTSRGTAVTRELALSPGAYEDVNRPARERCGLLPADESLVLTPTSVAVVDRSVVVRAVITNRSLLPLELIRLREAAGLAMDVTPGLPIQLPVQNTPGTTDKTVTLTLRFRVKSCGVLLETLQHPNPSALSQQLVRAWVVRDSTAFELDVITVDPSSSFRPPVDATEILDPLLRTCVDY